MSNSKVIKPFNKPSKGLPSLVFKKDRAYIRQDYKALANLSLNIPCCKMEALNEKNAEKVCIFLKRLQSKF
jgi:hypothetical protein